MGQNLPRTGRREDVPPANGPALTGKQRHSSRASEAEHYTPLARLTLGRGNQGAGKTQATIFR